VRSCERKREKEKSLKGLGIKFLITFFKAKMYDNSSLLA
jgi:hypothetical protein